MPAWHYNIVDFAHIDECLQPDGIERFAVVQDYVWVWEEKFGIEEALSICKMEYSYLACSLEPYWQIYWLGLFLDLYTAVD